MSDFSRTLVSRSGYDRAGFGELYDAARPRPPVSLLEILTHLARADPLRLVIDLGAGTGLSTRVWADRAAEVVGVEANPAMLAQARAASGATNLRYREAFAADTGLEAGRADLVTCAQSFHWMEPQPVLAEAARLLRPGGVFAAYDYDVPPVIDPEIDEAFGAHFAARGAARRRLDLEAGAASWPKERHVDEIRASGAFRLARDLVCHGWEEVDAARVTGLAESIGSPHPLFREAAAPEVGQTFERLRETAERVLGDRHVAMLVCYRIRVGIL